MEPQSVIAETGSKPPRRWNIFRPLTENPVVMKEVRGRMRGNGSVILLSLYLGVICAVICLIYLTLTTESSYTAWDPSFRQGVGKAIFGTVVLLELLLVSFIGPSLTSGAITSERERQTFDLLRTTTLSARSLVLGKLGSSLAYLLLLIIAGLPIESIAFLLGGVGLEEVIVSTLMLIVTAIFYCTLGIFFSSLMKRTLGATVSSYAAIILSFILLVVAFFLTSLVNLSYSSVPNKPLEIFVTLVVWLLVSTNPLLAAIVSETVLIDEQNLFVTHTSIFGSSPINVLPSPWIPFVVIYLLMSVMMVALSIRFVNRPDR